MGAPTPPHKLASMQADIDAGLPQLIVASRANVSTRSVQRLVSLGHLRVTEHQFKSGFATGSSRNGIYPSWLPRDLRADYIDNLRLYGEEHAARLARAAKAEAMLVEA